MTRIIIDTGPLVACVNRRDRWHSWVADQIRRNGRQVIPLLRPA